MDFKKRAKELVSKMTLEEKMGQMKYNAPAIPRLGIPAYNWWNEALHGVARSGTATVFPQAIGMAASFNDQLMEEVATAISDEARAKYNEYKTFGDTQIYQGLTLWSPNINIFRDPRWGRGHETYGEDPYLTGRMGSAFVRGLQGYDPVYRKTDATLKHFAVHSGPEGLRHGFNAEVDQKDLYETYLSAFRYCIDHAHPAAVMGAYNRVNGEACCASPTLMEILRGEFGFDGYYVSDCGAIRDIDMFHKLAASPDESAAMAANAGCDLNCGDAYVYLQVAYEKGLVSEEVITRSVERLMEARLRLGMFDDGCPYDSITMDVVESPEHIALNREMARQSMVLLKNDGILPLKGGETIAVIGPNADSQSVLLGNYNGTPSQYTTLLRGIQEASSGKVNYARGCHLYKDDEPGSCGEHPYREAVLAAKRSDVVILCMGLDPTMEGEQGDAFNGDGSGDKVDLELPACQKVLYEEIIKTGKPVIFVNVSGSCISLVRQDEECAAVLQCFYPGAEGGHALADILFGKASPSGRLPVTFYRSADDLPDFTDYSMEGRTYRFFKGSPLYPFGFGLSYTSFTENWLDDKTVEVTNTGSMDSWHTVLQIRDTPYPTLIGFTKVWVKAGETVTAVVKQN